MVPAFTANGSQAAFTLALPSDSAFTTLTGASTVQVYQQAGTQLRGLSSIANASVVQVRGHPAQATDSLPARDQRRGRWLGSTSYLGTSSALDGTLYLM